MPGSKYWAHSYIVLNDDSKIWLATHFYELDEQMELKKEVLDLRIARTLTPDRIKIERKLVKYYGEKID